MLVFLKTLLKLGLWNVIYVAWYRFSLKSGIRKLWFPASELPADQDFFYPATKRNDYPEQWKTLLLQDADKIISGNLHYYSFHWKEIGNPPNWFLNPFNGNTYPNPHLHWNKLPDFHPAVGDIKNIWEASRFDWVVTLASAYAATGESRYLKTLNEWLKDWCKHNPLNTGPNWKCGQEASIRVFNLLNAAFILQQHDKPTTALIQLIEAHLKRIQPNIRYAIAQDNNHGTSEAAGLFIGGSWLAKANGQQPTANSQWLTAKTNLGRYWLENRAKKLITADGSFSQHAVNYHRVMLDTLSFTEFWRVTNNQKPFSPHFYAKARAATNWLDQLTDNLSGNAPNLGANDGARLLNLNSSNYRDYRPSIQLAGLLFFKHLRFDKLEAESLFWLGLLQKNSEYISPVKSSSVLKSGYVTLFSTDSWALVRFPYFKFRPSHNDVFHIDLWFKGQNIICDAGTYSYNPPAEDKLMDLKSVHAHNTVSFDGNEQMPKISRFLLGNWLKPDKVGEIKKDNEGWQYWEGQYTDNAKNTHKRKISTNGKTWLIEDTLTGSFKTATIGFNLNTTEAQLQDHICTTPFGTITINTNRQQPPKTFGANSQQPITKLSLTTTPISEHYYQKRSIQRLNITITKPNTYLTTIHLA